MNKSRPSRGSMLAWLTLLAVGAGVLALPASANAQQSTVTGTVTDAQTGEPIAAATVTVAGTGSGTLTDASGRFSIQAPGNGTLAVGRLGYTPVQVGIDGRTTVNVRLEVSATQLEELVVTGYGTQRRGDITAAISSVDMEGVESQTSSSVIQRLSGRVSGVTVENSGSPGARSTVRIRGISSFQNNDPLYIVDGVPVEETYANFLNPNDVENIQVLKDASAASIYGARANNGVIIITTKKGQRGSAPQVNVDLAYGIANAYRGYDDFLIQDPLDYFEFERRRYVNAGLAIPSSLTAIYGDPNNPTVPDYIYAHPSTVLSRDQWGRPTVDEARYSYPNALVMPGSVGTNWWDEVFDTGDTKDLNVSVRGGGDNERYSVGFSYFDQAGTAIGNRFQRGTVRVNTDFNSGRFTVGENLTVALEEAYGGIAGDNFGEGSLIGKNILSQPVIPVYDVGGNWASGKSPGLGNNSNPVREAQLGPDRRNRNTRVFGNAFARVDLTDAIFTNSSLGINAGEGASRGWTPIRPEDSEPSLVNGINESNNYFTNWTITNTVNLQQTFAEQHNLSLLAGHEAIHSRSRSIGASMNGLVSTDVNARYIQPALGDPATRNVTSSGGVSALLSWFGKADYNFGGRYYLSGTLRHDGSSRLGEAYRWGTFPSFSLGWRVSEEPFMAQSNFITNLMLRAGWGITGNQNIPAGRTVSGFGGSVATSFYDISGADHSVITGYRQTSIGNPDLKWEENQTTNIGMDLEILGTTTFELDVYERNSDNLLFNPPLPATAGAASAPIVNIGQMKNTGVDAALGLRGTLGGSVNWDLNINGSHYRNEIVRIDGEQDQFPGPTAGRAGTMVMNRVGNPIGAFYGFRTEGFYESQQQIDQLNANARTQSGRSDAQYFTGAAPGRIHFADINGRNAEGQLTGQPDGVVNADDRTIIGSPHPDFTGGVNLGLRWSSFDFAADLFGTFGNEIWDMQKEFYVFRVFPTNVRQDLLTDSWTPENTSAKYPILDANDNVSNQPSEFYIEDGSYVRLRSLQIGYTVPPQRVFSGMNNLRIYVRGENLFTITGYDGLDPALPALSAGGSAGDIRDQARGIDRGVYPTSRIFTLGVGIGF
jgi:TonB-dependent starch-binding outer membrane protein SusC